MTEVKEGSTIGRLLLEAGDAPGAPPASTGQGRLGTIMAHLSDVSGAEQDTGGFS